MRLHVIVASQREAIMHLHRSFEAGLMQDRSEVK
jgi:hypothetical protein